MTNSFSSADPLDCQSNSAPQRLCSAPKAIAALFLALLVGCGQQAQDATPTSTADTDAGDTNPADAVTGDQATEDVSAPDGDIGMVDAVAPGDLDAAPDVDLPDIPLNCPDAATESDADADAGADALDIKPAPPCKPGYCTQWVIPAPAGKVAPWLYMSVDLQFQYSSDLNSWDSEGGFWINGVALLSGLDPETNIYTMMPYSLPGLALQSYPFVLQAVSSKPNPNFKVAAQLWQYFLNLAGTFPVTDGTFDVPTTVAISAARMRISYLKPKVCSPVRILLNGHGIGWAAPFSESGPNSASLVVAAWRLRESMNILTAVDASGKEVPVQFQEVQVATGEDIKFQTLGEDAKFWLTKSPSFYYWSPTWAVVRLTDPNVPTTLTSSLSYSGWLKGKGPVLVQDQVQVTIDTYRVLTTEMVNDDFGMFFACSGSKCPAHGNVADIHLVLDWDRGGSHCWPKAEIPDNKVDDDCDGLTDNP